MTTFTLRGSVEARYTWKVVVIQASYHGDLPQSALSVKSQRYDELHNTGAATVRVNAAKLKTTPLILCAIRR